MRQAIEKLDTANEANDLAQGTSAPAKTQQAEWLADNRAAIVEYNQCVQEHGVFFDGFLSLSPSFPRRSITAIKLRQNRHFRSGNQEYKPRFVLRADHAERLNLMAVTPEHGDYTRCGGAFVA